MPNFRFSPGCNCCEEEVPEPEDCFIVEDDFNRANSTNIGSDWVEKTGDWDIYSQYLRIQSHANAQAYNLTYWDTTTRGSDLFIRVTALIRLDTAADEAVLLVRAIAQTRWVYALLRAVSSSCTQIELWETWAGVHTKLAEGEAPVSSINNWLMLSLCYVYDPSASINAAAAILRNSSEVILKWIQGEPANSHNNAWYAGVGTKTCTGDVYFDDFEFKSTDMSDSCTPCVSCLLEWDRFEGDDISCLWTEQSGDWYISPYYDMLWADCADYTTHLITGQETDSFVAQFTRDYLSSGHVIYSLIDYVDSNNYHYAKLQPISEEREEENPWGTGGTYDLVVGKCTAGVEADAAMCSYMLQDWPAYGHGITVLTGALQVALQDNNISAKFQYAQVDAATTLHGGDLCGIKIDDCPGSSWVGFDWTSWLGEKNELRDYDCYPCINSCAPCACGKRELDGFNVTLSGWSGGECSDLNGTWSCVPGDIEVHVHALLLTQVCCHSACVYESAVDTITLEYPTIHEVMVRVVCPSRYDGDSDWGLRIGVEICFRVQGTEQWTHVLYYRTSALGATLTSVDCTAVSSESATLVYSIGDAEDFCTEGTVSVSSQ